VLADADRHTEDTTATEQSSSTLDARRGHSLSPSRVSNTQSPVQGRSPGQGRGRSVSPGFPHATYTAVQEAMHRRQLQVGEMKAQLTAARERQQSLSGQLDEVTSDCHRLDQIVVTLTDDNDTL